jgi:hypothetical protein
MRLTLTHPPDAHFPQNRRYPEARHLPPNRTFSIGTIRTFSVGGDTQIRYFDSPKGPPYNGARDSRGLLPPEWPVDPRHAGRRRDPALAPRLTKESKRIYLDGHRELVDPVAERAERDAEVSRDSFAGVAFDEEPDGFAPEVVIIGASVMGLRRSGRDNRGVHETGTSSPLHQRLRTGAPPGSGSKGPRSASPAAPRGLPRAAPRPRRAPAGSPRAAPGS